MLTKEIDFRRKRLFYQTTGDGLPVVLLHGFAETSLVWKSQFAIFPNNKLIVPDLPGSGESEAINDMSMENLAGVVKAIIDNECESQDKEQVVLIGHSMGGYVTLAFAEKYADNLAGLGIFHSTAFADSEEKKEVRRKGIRFIQEHGAGEFLKTTTPNLYAPATKDEHPELIDEQLAETRNFSAASLVSYYEAMMQRPDRTAVLRETKLPVLFVMGRHDNAVPIKDGLAQCHLPQNVYIHVLEQSGHMGMIEEAEEANRILLEFVNDIQKIA